MNVGRSLEGSKMEGGAGVEEDSTPFPLYTPAHTFPRTAISRDILQINRSSHLAHQFVSSSYPVLSTFIHNNYYSDHCRTYDNSLPPCSARDSASKSH